VTFGFAAEGDTNLDGVVDVGDLQNMLASGKYGTGAAAVWAEGDFNFDGVVDVSDLQDVLASGLYGRGGFRSAALSRLAPMSLTDPSGPGLLAGAITPVPEPASWMLVPTAAAWLALRKRRRR